MLGIEVEVSQDMSSGTGTIYSCGLHKGLISRFPEGCHDRKSPDEGRRIQRPKRCDKNNKDGDTSLHVKKVNASYQIFRQKS